MKKFRSLKLASVCLAAGLALSGCQVFRVYTIDLPQGTPISAEQASQLKVGMQASQVLYLLGSPAMRDTLSPNRWDYIYDFTAGTDGKRAKKPNVKNGSWYLSVYFDDQGLVNKIEGLESLPAKRHQ